MKSIINFYQNLDTLNLILFWGIIIVIILLLVFSIILVNKNKKLKEMLNSNNHNRNDDLFNQEVNDIPVINEKEVDIKPSKSIKEEPIEEIITPNIQIKEPVEEVVLPTREIKEPIKEETIIENNNIEEKNFIAEEHVMEYNQEVFNFPNIEKNEPEKEIIKEEPKKEEIKIPNAPYQRNVLREKYSNQTSPIGIVKREDNYQRNLNNAKELHNALNEEPHREPPSRRYLEEVSQKLSEATDLNDIDRTAYEIEQEEEAIISYKELMNKKDQIKIIDEEDAVISIDELMKRKIQEEKLYNITKEEENNTFIDELKQFRHDL